MQPIPAAVFAVTAIGLACSCSDHQLTGNLPQHEPPTTAAAAADRIVAARCDRKKRCAMPSMAEQTAQGCRLSEKREVDTNFTDNPNCVNGVRTHDLEHCIARINAEGCRDEDIDTAFSCRSRNLCLE